MEKKTKNEIKQPRIQRRFLVFIACSCLAAFASLLYKPNKNLFGLIICPSLAQNLQWQEDIRFSDAPESQIRINADNIMYLERISYLFNSTVPDTGVRFYTAIVSPQQNYVLALQPPDTDSSIKKSLVVCQNNDTSKHILSADAHSFAISPRGDYIAVDNLENSQILIYNAYTLELYRTIQLDDKPSYIGNLAFHPSEPLIAFSTYHFYTESSDLYVLDYHTQEFVYQRFIQENWVRFMAFNDGGTLLFIQEGRRATMIAAYGIPSE